MRSSSAVRRWTALLSLLLSSCSSATPSSAPPDDSSTPSGAPLSWSTVYDDITLGGAFLSVWEKNAEVFAVGGGLGNGSPTLVVRGAEGRWSLLSPGGSETLWWVFGQSPSAVWMVGEQGRIVLWNGSAFIEHRFPTTATLFGVWASVEGEAWAVGGSPTMGTGAANDVVLHWDGASWQREPLPGPARGETLYKVWGRSKDDVFAVGENGALWHRRAGVWEDERNAIGASESLTSVTGCADEIFAAGGQTVAELHADSWLHLLLPDTARVVGVACGMTPENLLLVGWGSLKLFRASNGWRDDTFVEPYVDLHGSWMTADGEAWAVGGDYVGEGVPGRARRGTVARFGHGNPFGPFPTTRPDWRATPEAPP